MVAGQGVSNKVVAKTPEIISTPKASTHKPESKSSSNPNARQNLINTEPKSAASAVQINHTNVAQPAAVQLQLPLKTKSDSKPLNVNNVGKNENKGVVQTDNRPPLPQMQPTVLPKAKLDSDKQPTTAVIPAATTNAPVVNQVVAQQGAPGQNTEDVKKTAEKILPIVGDLSMHHPNSGRRETTLNQYSEGVAKAIPDIVQVSTDLTAAGLPTNPCLVIAHVDMEGPSTPPDSTSIAAHPLQMQGSYDRAKGYLVGAIGEAKYKELSSGWTTYQSQVAEGVGFVKYHQDGAFGKYLADQETLAKASGQFSGDVFGQPDKGLTIALSSYHQGVGNGAKIIWGNEHPEWMEDYAKDVMENAQAINKALDATGDPALINLCEDIPAPNYDVLPSIQRPAN